MELRLNPCGNATRCVADMMMHEEKMDHVVLQTMNGALNCYREGKDLVRVEMGEPKLKWKEIPLSKECDPLNLPLEGNPIAVNIGNPHCVFFLSASGLQATYGRLEEWSDEIITRLGQTIETHPLFPNKTNVEFVDVLSPTQLRMRVWERGVGITQACGSGACAVAVAAIKHGLTERKVTVTLDGGDLIINWPSNDAQISMTGPVSYVFNGETNLI